MRHLNYSHLQYFWVVAREGSIVAAAEVLHLTPQTISGQLKLLDEAVGQPLFVRAGRGLVLSDVGRVVFDYAEDIFSLGAELTELVRGKRTDGPELLTIGVVSSMPKLVVERIIAPAMLGESALRVRCIEDTLEKLLGDLAVHRLDLVLSDQSIPHGLSLRAFSHLLGQSDLSFFVRKPQARRYRARFPASLHDAPMLLPARSSALRRKLDEWLEQNGIVPNVVGEFDDSALLKAFGEAGAGLFPAPSVIAPEICRMYRTSVVGTTAEVVEKFYAISPERKLKRQAVKSITDQARSDLFGGTAAK
ncbi:MAG: transcriptional activator NhaR [Pseudomonadota bacterium]